MNEFAQQVQALRPQLLRYARAQLRQAEWAEDAVSDTVLAALERPTAFAGASQLKTWLVGILKHKLIDQLRRHQREATTLDADDACNVDELLFDASGHWRTPPAAWPDHPEALLTQRQFLAVLDACVERLPAAQGRAFMMREWLELDAEEICKELAISSTNLWVLLHRARLRLRDCLQQSWFEPARSSAVGGRRP